MAGNVATEQVLQQVHELTGRPVIVDADPDLKLIASSKIARGADPAHLISYNPTASANADYLIVFQCGFILRMFSLPVSERFDFQGSWRGRKEVEKLFTEHLRIGTQSVSKEMRPVIAAQLFDGLVR